jgi:hypothetical protein
MVASQALQLQALNAVSTCGDEYLSTGRAEQWVEKMEALAPATSELGILKR